MVKKMNKKVLIFTTTVRKNTSIGKFYGNLCEELNKSKINYKIIAIRDFNIKIPKIIEFLRLKDYYIAKKIDEIENINLDISSLKNSKKLDKLSKPRVRVYKNSAIVDLLYDNFTSSLNFVLLKSLYLSLISVIKLVSFMSNTSP